MKICGDVFSLNEEHKLTLYVKVYEGALTVIKPELKDKSRNKAATQEFCYCYCKSLTVKLKKNKLINGSIYVRQKNLEKRGFKFILGRRSTERLHFHLLSSFFSVVRTCFGKL